MDRIINAVPGRRGSVMFALLLAASAATAAGTEHREHDAHMHGHGTLNVAAEGNELYIELRVPGVNVVGFEHQPETDKERRAVETALSLFSRAEKLFVPSESARCKAEEAEVSFAGEMHREGDAHEKHSEHGEKHSEHGESAHEQEEHAELHGEYHFHCAAPERLERIEVRVFEHLKNAEELEANVVTPTLQNAVTLRPGEASVLRLDLQ